MNAKILGTGGEDEVIVLGHGYGGEQSIWEKIVPGLQEKHQVVLFDWNFSGAFNNHENNSHGFDPLQYNSLDVLLMIWPHLFTKLILIGASPRYINSEDYEGGFEATQIEQLISTIESNFQPWAAAFAPLAVGGKEPQLSEKFEKSLKKMKPEVALAVAKIIFLGDYRHVLEKVDTPCTIISTTNDLVVPSSVPYYMQKKMINAKSRVEIIDVDGHFPHLTAHDEVLNVITKVLDS
uniref:AB hydrolase-1 domain-containing protein n=1 Tax=Chenopodium quinoa TaxID=63459 RepID=A0A803MQ44_CHEQI